MAKVGRKPYMDVPERWHITVPGTLAEQVNEMLRDPLTGRIIYGARNKLITQLLRQYM